MSKSYDESPEGVAELLEDAADLLEHTEWIQGSLTDNVYYHGGEVRTGYCAIGAVGYSLNEYWDQNIYTMECDPVFQQATKALRKVVVERVSAYGDIDSVRGAVELYNDDDDRTKQDVLDVFRKAAKDVLS